METQQQQSESFLTFKLNGEIFAAGIEKVLEILEVPKITYVPRAPDHMRGVINLRGNVLPVFDTRAKFGFSTADDQVETCIVVMRLRVGAETISIGAVVDAVEEVMEIPGASIQAPPSMGSKYKTEFIQGMVKYNDQFIMILNLDLVFTTDELSILNEVAV